MGKNYYLVWICQGQVQILNQSGNVPLLQMKKKQKEKEPQFKKGQLKIYSEQGYKYDLLPKLKK